MKASIVKEPGSAENIIYSEVDKPVPKQGEILIRVHAAGVNGADLIQRAGQYDPPEGTSKVLGLEVAGEVEETGKGVTSFKKGDRVMALLDGGGYAEYVTVLEGLAMPLPQHLDYVQGAAIPEVWLTAYLELIWLGKLKKGEDLLIHAGASGVGTAAIQLAKVLGAQVFITAGSEEKVQFCKDLGADVGINYKKECFRQIVEENTGNKPFATGIPLIWSTQQWGVDVILDLVGAVHFPKNLDTLNLEGRLLLVGTGSGVKTELDSLGKIIGKRLSIIGSTMRARPKPFKKELIQEFAKFATPYFADGTFKPIVDKTFPLSQAAEAHKYLESKRNKGKIILTS